MREESVRTMNRFISILAILAVASLIYFVGAAQQSFITDARQLAGNRSLANQLVSSDLVLGTRSFLGAREAPITLVVVVDFFSNTSKEDYFATVPFLMREYVESGEARLYHKYYLPEDDYNGKKGRFKYALLASCYDGDDRAGFNEALFTAREDELDALAREHHVPEDCLRSVPETLYEDMLETRLFRLLSPSLHIAIDGRDATVLMGIPSPERINQTIRRKQVTLGI